MLETLERWDQQLFLWLNSFNAKALDGVMFLLTKGWFWTPVFALLLWKLWKQFPTAKQYVVIILSVGLTVTACDMISTRALKHQIKRYRPTHNLEIGPRVHTVNDFNGNEYRGGKYGFVSSHAANFFGIATLCFVLLGKRKRYWWLFVWAGLVSYTRIYLGVHYPGDILGGMLLGILSGALFATLALRMISQLQRSHG